MALITSFTEFAKDTTAVHGPVECGYAIFERDGRRYLQLDTYGSQHRRRPGKVSQSIQLDRERAQELLGLIRKTFPGL